MSSSLSLGIWGASNHFVITAIGSMTSWFIITAAAGRRAEGWGEAQHAAAASGIDLRQYACAIAVCAIVV